MLTLPIKKKWFDMIILKEKKEEYREVNKYYGNRLYKYKDKEFEIIFRNGYSSASPFVRCIVSWQFGYGREEWGAEKGRLYYVLNILKILEIGNIKEANDE